MASVASPTKLPEPSTKPAAIRGLFDSGITPSPNVSFTPVGGKNHFGWNPFHTELQRRVASVDRSIGLVCNHL